MQLKSFFERKGIRFNLFVLYHCSVFLIYGAKIFPGFAKLSWEKYGSLDSFWDIIKKFKIFSINLRSFLFNN